MTTAQTQAEAVKQERAQMEMAFLQNSPLGKIKVQVAAAPPHSHSKPDQQESSAMTAVVDLKFMAHSQLMFMEVKAL